MKESALHGGEAPEGDDLTLDPSDWSEMRSLAHRMTDDVIDLLQGIREEEVWRPGAGNDSGDLFRSPVPREPLGAERVYRDFLEHVRPYPYGNIHPRFWGYVVGTGTPMGVLADFLAAGLNPNVAFGDQAAVRVELQVLSWFKDLLGFPGGSTGLLVSGGSVANLVGVCVAAHARAEHDLGSEGHHRAPRRMIMYASDEAHNSLEKAARIIGLGSSNLRRVATDGEGRMDVEALRRQIGADRNEGLHPACVIGTAGTVDGGAFDDLEALADLAAAEGMWFHVDGAFGALAALVPSLRHLTAGLERADSVAFDLHKWMYLPIEVGCVLVRDSEAHRRTFSVPGSYLTRVEGGIADGDENFIELGPQLSRGFRALKVWMAIREQGIDRFARIIEQNVRHAMMFGKMVEEHPRLELLRPVPLNVVCFRYVPATGDPDVDALNRRILVELQRSGFALPSHTVVEGQFAIRLANTNHRSRAADFRALLERVVDLGDELAN